MISLGTSSRLDSANIMFITFKHIPKYVVSRYRRKNIIKDLAIQRAKILYSLAVTEVRGGNYERARRYVDIALRIIEKANVRKPLFLRRGACKHCHIPLIPGLTCRVRIRSNRKYIIVTKTCLLCGWVRRIPCIRKVRK